MIRSCFVALTLTLTGCVAMAAGPVSPVGTAQGTWHLGSTDVAFVGGVAMGTEDATALVLTTWDTASCEGANPVGETDGYKLVVPLADGHTGQLFRCQAIEAGHHCVSVADVPVGLFLGQSGHAAGDAVSGTITRTDNAEPLSFAVMHCDG